MDTFPATPMRRQTKAPPWKEALRWEFNHVHRETWRQWSNAKTTHEGRRSGGCDSVAAVTMGRYCRSCMPPPSSCIPPLSPPLPHRCDCDKLSAQPGGETYMSPLQWFQPNPGVQGSGFLLLLHVDGWTGHRKGRGDAHLKLVCFCQGGRILWQKERCYQREREREGGTHACMHASTRCN